MRAIRSLDMKPEIMVRKLVYSAGYRFRLHKRELPGTPDLVFPSRKRVIFVHGCFWHGHRCRRGGRKLPKTNKDYWRRKIVGNRARDVKVIDTLAHRGWRAIVVWECELRDDMAVLQRLRRFLGPR
jgi:DNA mismatch endonuclease, patch repair protein